MSGLSVSGESREERNYVTFYGPGRRLISYQIDSWDIEKAKEMARKLAPEPFKFNFCKRRRNDEELDSRIVMASSMYFLGVTPQPLEDGDVVLEWP